MSEGQNVGSISIKVTPDLTQFRAELHAELTAIEKAEKVNISSDFDGAGLAAKAKAAAANAGTSVKFKADFDNIDELMADLAKGMGSDSVAHLRAKLETDEASAQLKAWEAQHANEKVGVKLDMDWGNALAVRAYLQKLFDFKAHVKVEVDQGSLLAAEAEKAAADGISKIGSAAAGGGPSLFSFAGMLAMVAAAVAILLPPVLALTSGILLLAPSLLSLVVPAGAVALGLDGIAKAAENAGLYEDKKPGKKGGGSLGAALQDIKKAVSDNFTAALTEPFKQLGTLFPAIQDNMVGVSGGLSMMISGFVNAVSKGQGLADVNNIIGNVGRGLGEAAPGVERFTQGILHLVSAISDRFPGMGEGFSRLGQEFSDWINKITTKDAVTGVSTLDTTLQGLKATWDQFSGLGTDLFKQGLAWMSDPSFGSQMKTFFGDVRTFITDTLPGLGTVFSGLVRGLNDMTPAFKAITPALELFGKTSDLFTKLNNLNPLSADKLKTGGLPFDLNNPFAKQHFRAKSGSPIDMFLGYMGFGPGDDPVAAAQPAITKGVDGIVNSAQTYFQTKMTAANTVKVGGMAEDGGVGMAVSGAVDTAILAAKSKLASFQAEFGGLLDTALAPLKDVPAKIGTALGGAAAAITASFGPMQEAAYAGVNAVSTTIITAFGNMGMAVQGVFGIKIAGAIRAGLGTAAGAAVTGAGMVVQAVLSGLTPILGVVGTIFNALPQVISAGMSACVQIVAAQCSAMVTTAMAYAGAMIAAGTAIAAGLATGIRNGTGLVEAAANDMMKAAHKPIPNSPAETGPFSGKGWVLYSGMSIGESFAEGINASTDQVVGAANNLVTQLNDAFDKGIDLDQYKGDVTRAMKDITVKSDEIRNNLNLLPKGKEGKEARAPLNAELDKLKAVQGQLKLQKDKMGLDDEAEKKAKDAKKMWMDLGERGVNSAMDLGTNVLQGFAADLGIGGSGAIPTLLKQGLQFGSQYVFHVANMDDALRVQTQDQQMQSIGMVGR